MSDIYVKDTEKAMHKFANWFEYIEDSLRDEFKESYSTFASEVEGLIEQYKDKLEKIEELEEEIQELKD